MYIKLLFKKPLFWVFVLAIIVFSGYLFLKINPKNVYTVGRGGIKSFLSSTGKLDADKKAELSFKSAGKIAEVYVSEGEVVKKGEPLSKLDTVSLGSVYQEALNTYRKYQATAENVLDQVQGHAGDETFAQKDARTTAEVARDNAYEGVKQAADALKNATIRAPFAGTVAVRDLEVGEEVSAFSLNPQIVLIDPETVYFSAEVDQKEVGKVEIGQKAKVSLDAFPGNNFEGEVFQIAKTVRQTEGGDVVEVKIKLSSPPKSIIGLSGDTEITLEEKEGVLLVPKEAVFKKNGGNFVRTLSGQKKVVLGIFDGANWEVVDGLSDGEKILW